jgi:hypothetical protein
VLAPTGTITHTIVCASLMDALNKNQLTQLVVEMQSEASAITDQIFA